ncbi:hypothetical protein JBL43_14545 [Aureibaculum sp. A20]|uniref:Uncharacterized protein n=1 Tax=Aureibaculum flavum TaxID=2795986 RepID=A0ABS0WU21_9FLAO|nr:hypothetical protein [Aureibaculum flavum]MBJ2175468.1 hypothetical protein [Aureibaculum flavum]
MSKKKLEHIKKSGYKTPQAYFDMVEDAVFAKMTSETFPKKEGFENPDDYFNSIEENVLQKLQLDNEKKESGYKIPKNYLDSIEDHVLEKIKSKKSKSKVIDFKTIFLKRLIPLAAAASLLIFIFINYNNSTTDTSLDQLASAEIEQWIDEDLIAFDTYEITDVFEDIELESQPIFEDDEIIEFLNGTDIENLILEN